jgi:hypothetical protein
MFARLDRRCATSRKLERNELVRCVQQAQAWLEVDERKALLARLLGEPRPLIRFSDHVVGSGATFREATCRQ